MQLTLLTILPEFINFLASWVLLALAVLTFSGQFLYLRVITLSLAVSFAGGAYAAAALGPDAGVPRLLLGMAGGMVMAALGGAFDRWAGVRIHSLALLASFGFLKIFQAAVELSGYGGVRAFPLSFNQSYSFLELFNKPIWLPAALVGLLLFSILLFTLYRFAGLRLSAIAVGDDTRLAALFGVSSRQVYFSVQLLGGAIGGFTGVLMAADGGLRPDLGFSTCIKAFGVLIATGGNWMYLLPLTLLLVLGEYLAAYYLGGHAKEAVGFILLGGALILYPRLKAFSKMKQKQQNLAEGI